MTTATAPRTAPATALAAVRVVTVPTLQERTRHTQVAVTVHRTTAGTVVYRWQRLPGSPWRSAGGAKLPAPPDLARRLTRAWTRAEQRREVSA